MPRPLLHSGNLDFSFAGLKTAVMVQAKKLVAAALPQHVGALAEGFVQLPAQQQADLAASTEAAIVDVLVQEIADGHDRRPACAGWSWPVAWAPTGPLRQQLDAACAKRGIRVYYPELDLCTDNGAMIALAGAMRLQVGQPAGAATVYAFDVKPRWPLDQLWLTPPTMPGSAGGG